MCTDRKRMQIDWYNFHMSKTAAFFLGTLGALFLFIYNVQAASLYIDPATSELFRGDAIELAVRLDTDEANRECVNAVDVVLNYSDNIAPVDISIGDSIISLWVENPTINTEDKTITFAGGIPNGYCGRVVGDPRLTNTLATVIVRSPGFTIGGGGSSGATEATVSFSPETTAFLNDGRGSKASLNTFGTSLTLNPNAGTGIRDEWREAVAADETPPEEFSITLAKDERAFGGRYYISFNTTDKQTGIDQYQVIEEPITNFGAFDWGGVTAPWEVTRSPYVIKDQSLNVIIRVKAIDKAGNEYIATLVPDESLRTTAPNSALSFIFVAALFVLIVIIGAVLFLELRRRFIRKSKINDPEQNKYDDAKYDQENTSDKHE